MKAEVIYRLDYVPHPWDAELRKDGVKAYCLMKVTKTIVGETGYEPVAMFNLDSEAKQFAGHVFELGLNDRLVRLEADLVELFESIVRLRGSMSNRR